MSVMVAYVFPGQGSQYPGMGQDVYNQFSEARKRFQQAEEILGFDIGNIMFEGTEDDLKQTDVTQPSIFLHSVVLAETLNPFNPGMVAGHSLGEISALTAAGALSFEEGLQLVFKRARAMQKACEAQESVMAAVIGLDDETVERVCKETEGTVVPANYNCPGQVVISGGKEAVDNACEKLKEAGARRAMPLPVGGGFHSPYMEQARAELEEAIQQTAFQEPSCPVYQNATALPATDVETIRKNLIDQLTAPVLWTQTVQKMMEDGAEQFIECGPGKVLQGLVKKVDRKVSTDQVAVPAES